EVDYTEAIATGLRWPEVETSAATVDRRLLRRQRWFQGSESTTRDSKDRMQEVDFTAAICRSCCRSLSLQWQF
ncbi:Hypothetical predicted protein, partial [Olea europaea subsp. europaea]